MVETFEQGLPRNNDRQNAEVAFQDEVMQLRAVEDAQNRRPAPLSGRQLEDAQNIQNQIIELFPLMGGENNRRQQQTDAIRAEQRENRFGPASQAAYREFITWVQERQLPAVITRLQQLQLPIPPGSPVQLAGDGQGGLQHPDVFRAEGGNRRLQYTVRGLNPDRPLESADQVMQVADWLGRAGQAIATERGNILERNLVQQIAENHLPAGWLEGREQNPEGWRASAADMVSLAMRTRNFAAAAYMLSHAQGSQFPWEPPPGARVREQNGQITVDLDLPTNVRMDDPATRQRVDAMQQWLNRNADRIQRALEDYETARGNPLAALQWGDTEMRGVRGVFNADNQLVQLVPATHPQDRLPEGHTLRDFNLLEARMNARIETRNENGQPRQVVVVEQNFQAQQIPWYGYLNMVWSNVGNANTRRVELDPNAFVMVNVNGRIEPMQARNLPGHINSQRAWHYGEKIVTATMDAAMIASGTIEVAAAYRAARVGLAAARGLTRVGVGAAGVLNNAGARETDWGSGINTARGLYFLGDISLGLARRGIPALRGAAETNLQQALTGMPWLSRAHNVTNGAFRAAEAGFAPLVVRDLGHALGAHGGNADGALRLLGDGRGIAAPNERDRIRFNGPAEAAVLRSYSEMLQAGRTPEVRQEVASILSRTQELMQENANPEARRQFANELAARFLANGQAIANQQRQRRQQLDAAGIDNLSSGVSPQNAEVRAAAAIALLMLNARDNGGRLPANLAQITTHVPAWRYSVEGRAEVSHPARDVQQTLTSERIVSMLRTDLAAVGETNRGIPLGETLLRLGAISGREYASVLQNVLNNPNSTATDRMNAMTDAAGPRLATLIDAIRLEERQNPGNGHFGTTSADLMRTLGNVARSDSNASNRAMAAALLFGLSEADPNRRAQFLRDNSDRRQQAANGGAGGAEAYSTFVREHLTSQMNQNANTDAARETILNAGRQLALLTAATDAQGQQNISRAFARAFSGTMNVEFASRVLEHLTPERVAQLPAEERNALLRRGVSLLNVPSSFEQEAQLVRLMQQMRPLFNGADQQLVSEYSARVRSFIDARPASDRPPGPSRFAENYPDLRAAAITELAHLRSDNALTNRIVRDRLINDADPRVRLAAVDTLRALRDPEFGGNFLLDRIDAERDPEVAARLRQTRFEQRREEPSSREYRDRLNNVRAEIERASGMPSHEESRRYLANLMNNPEFAMLNGQNWIRARNHAADNAYGWAYAATSFEGTLAMRRLEARDRFDRARDQQWDALVQRARGADGSLAIGALYQIMTRSESGVATAENQMNERVRIHSDHVTMQDRAARALADLATTAQRRDVVAFHIEQGLLNADLNLGTRFHLLDAYRALSQHNRSGITPERFSSVVALALRREVGTGGNGDAGYVSALMQELERANNRLVYPELQGIAERHSNAAVRENAQRMINRMRDGLDIMYDGTPIDRNRDAAAAVQQLNEAMRNRERNRFIQDGNRRFESEQAADNLVQSIFTNYRGAALNRPGDADALRSLTTCLQDNNDKVSLAAARVIVESQLPANHPARAAAMQTLARVVFAGEREQHRADAAAIIGRLPNAMRPELITLSPSTSVSLQTVGGRVVMVQRTNGAVTGVVDGQGTLRRYQYENGQLVRMTDAEGNECERVRQGNALTNRWTARTRSGTTSTFEATVTVSNNGEYRAEYANRTQRAIATVGLDGRVQWQNR